MNKEGSLSNFNKYLDKFDKFVIGLFPSYGVRRLKNRYKAKGLLDAVRNYDGASKSGRNSRWRATGNSADSEIRIALPTLRARSRDLVRNNPYAAKAIEGIAANVVGGGIRPSIKHKDATALKKAQELWEDWGETTKCDFYNHLDFYGLQFQVMNAVAESGEVLARKVKNLKNPAFFEIQLLEGDHIDDDKDGINLPGGGYIKLGIEYNKKGKIVAYWLHENHPGETIISENYVSKRIDAKEIIHVFFVKRPGQSRGVPFGVSSFDKMRDFDEYERAQLIKQKVSACFTAFVTSGVEALPGYRKQNENIPLERVEPGQIEYLRPNEEVTFGTPPSTEGYDIYAKKVLQQIAAGYGITYELLTNDLSNVNFSSGRMGWIEMGRMIAQWQNQIIVNKFCAGVWEWFADSIDISISKKTRAKATWTVPRREMIDPVKETKAMVEAVRAGFTSWQGAIRELGRDPNEVLAEMGIDKELFDKIGLMLSSDARYDPNRKPIDEIENAE